MTSPAGSKLSRSPAGGEPADAERHGRTVRSPAGSTAPAASPPLAAGDTKLPSGPGREATGPEGDEQDAAREWADQKAAEVGLIWISRFPTGKDWLATE